MIGNPFFTSKRYVVPFLSKIKFSFRRIRNRLKYLQINLEIFFNVVKCQMNET